MVLPHKAEDTHLITSLGWGKTSYCLTHSLTEFLNEIFTHYKPRLLMLQFSICNNPGAVYTVFLNCAEPLMLVMWMIYIFLDVSINLSCLRLKCSRSLMPRTTLWIPETYSVPHSQPKRTYQM